MPAVTLEPSSVAPCANPTRLARIGGAVAIALLVLVVWMDQSIFPIGVAVEGPDGSFQSAFEFFFKQGSRAGTDWVYTYGPLGFIENFTYDADLFVGRLIGADLLWRLACATALTLAFLRAATLTERVLAFVTLVLLPLGPDSYLYLFTLAAAELCMERPRSRALLALSIVALVPASLAKFTSFGLWVPCLAGISVARLNAVSGRAALRYVAASVALWLALWFACRQSLFDLPYFLWNSFDVARSYASGMGSECPPELEIRAQIVFVLLLLTLVIPLVGRPRAGGTFAPLLVRLFVLFAAFKAGLVRGADHSMIFFTFAALAPFAIVEGFEPRTWRRAAQFVLRIATFVVGCEAALVSQHISKPIFTGLALRAAEQVDWTLRLATEMPATHAELDRQVQLAKERRALPRMRARVGNDTIDIQPPYQDSVLLNGMNWRPRPVFQSYAVLSDHLQQLNARFFESERAPQWFILKPTAIDGRMETMEDAPAQVVIARDYRPVLEEQGLLLLQRVPAEKSDAPNEVVIERELHFGESLDLSGLDDALHLLQLEVAPTWRGRLRTLFLRPVPILAELWTASGRGTTVQLLPKMLETGAIVDPLLVDTQDWIRMWAGRADRTSSIKLLQPSRPWAWADTVRVRILRSPVRPAHSEFDSDWNTRFAMFATIPDDFTGKEQGVGRTEAGETVLAVGTPTALRFRIPAGHHKVSGAMGIVAEAYEKGACDGINFQGFFVLERTHYRKVFERLLDPRNNPGDRGAIAFEFEFDAETSGEVVLATRPGPNRDVRDDTAFWTRVRVE